MNIVGGVRAAGAGQNHSLAVKKNGTVWAWGRNGSAGLLGNGGTDDSAVPVQVVGLNEGRRGRRQLDAQPGTALRWAWGGNGNDSGQLGDGTMTTSLVLVQVSGLTNIVAIDAEYAQSFALGSDGTHWAWGENGWARSETEARSTSYRRSRRGRRWGSRTG